MADNSAGAMTDTGFDVSSGSGLIGGIGDMIIGPVMANVQKGWSSKAARRARQWAEYMRSTAYQATTADMRAAGLNPALAMLKGGSSTPSGPVADIPDVPDVSVSRALASGRQSALFAQELATAKAIRRKAEVDADVSARTAQQRAFADISLSLSNAAVNDANMVRTAADKGLIDEMREKTRVERWLAEYDLPGAKADADFWMSDQGRQLRDFNKYLDTGGKGVSLLPSLRSILTGRSRGSAKQGRYNRETGEVID